MSPIHLNASIYFWMALCGLSGLASFLYGIYEAEDLFFLASFWIWGASLLPLVFIILFRIFELIFSKTILALSFLGIIFLGGMGYFFRGSDLSVMTELLQNRNFIILLVIITMAATLVGVVGIAGKIAIAHFRESRRQEETVRASDTKLDMAEMETNLTLEMKRLEITNEDSLRRHELEQERMRLEHDRLHEEQKLLDVEVNGDGRVTRSVPPGAEQEANPASEEKRNEAAS